MRASKITFPGVAVTGTLGALAAMTILSVFPAAATERGDGPETKELTRVETEKVCMVNDAVFEKAQIPVEVEGKTYYGCCPMCEERLAHDVSIRTAVDPVTGERVDKATGVIAARPDGSVLYFASEETLAAYEGGERADERRRSREAEGDE